MGNSRIPVCSALLDGNEAKYLSECVESGWVSGSGAFVTRFESEFARHIGVSHAVTTSSGTAALHLALLGLGVGPGDEVIVPSLTMVACGNVIRYCGATPVIVDVEESTGNIDPVAMEAAITPRTKAVMVVHLYGLPCAMEKILSVCEDRGIAVVEDAAEAIGTRYRGARAGRLGRVGAFSFFANKVVTTGEGGMLVTSDGDIAHKARMFKDQWFIPERRFFHPQLGYNYRMSNLQAAVGVAQLERVEVLAAARRNVAVVYRELLGRMRDIELPMDIYDGGENSHWMYAVRVRGEGAGRKQELASWLRGRGVDSRDFFIPLHEQPEFARLPARCPVSEDLSRRGLLLPTGPTLTREQQERVAAEIAGFFDYTCSP